MPTKLNRSAYQKLIVEDVAWLLRQPRSLEREHIEQVLMVSPDREYGDNAQMRDNVAIFYEHLVTTQEFELAARLRDLLGFVPERSR